MKLAFPSPHRRRIGAAVCTVLLAAQLAACGGGGNDSSTNPPPSGGAPPTNPPVDPPADPTPTTVSVTLTGTVTDAPIANAVVTATVGGETFSATADANGDYSVEIEVDQANAGQFVTLNARGVGDQAFVEFVSLAGSVQALATQAGADGTLSSSENFATQITNVSTAEAVFLVQANAGQAITSDAQLTTLATEINAQDVLDLAAAIKLVVDDSQNYSMPQGQTSTLALASNPEERQAFVNDVYEQDPDAFAAAQVAIAQDPALAQPVDLTGVDALTTALMSTDAGFTFNYTGRIMHFDLLDGGQGSVSSETYEQAFTWTLTGSTIEVTYTSPVTVASFDTENCNGDVRQVRAQYTSAGAKITFLNPRTVTITTASDVEYLDCPQLAPRQDVSTVARTVLTLDHFQVIDPTELAGNTQTLYVYDSAQDTVTADIAQLAADGTGTTIMTGQSFTWSVIEDGKIVHAEFVDGTVAEYLNFRDIDNFVSDIFWEVRTPNGPVYMGAGAAVFADPDYAVQLTNEAVPGRYYQFGIGEETVPDARIKGFRLRFDVDQTGAQESDYIDENGNVVLDDETMHSYNGFRWEIDQNAVIVRRTYDVVEQEERCVYGNANCMLYDERVIIPLAMDGSRIYWVEQRRFNNQTGVSDSTPATRLVRYYDYEPLIAPASSGNSKLRALLPASKPRALLRGPQLH